MIPNPLKKDEGNENACEDNDKRSELVHSFTLKAIGESNVGGDGRSMVRELSKKSRGVNPATFQAVTMCFAGDHRISMSP